MHLHSHRFTYLPTYVESLGSHPSTSPSTSKIIWKILNPNQTKPNQTKISYLLPPPSQHTLLSMHHYRQPPQNYPTTTISFLLSWWIFRKKNWSWVPTKLFCFLSLSLSHLLPLILIATPESPMPARFNHFRHRRLSSHRRASLIVSSFMLN